MVPTRPACHWFEESCQNTAAATTQVHPAPCQSRPSKVKVVERQKQRRTGSDRPAPSAALLCRASSLAPLYQNPRVRRGTGMDACPMWPNQSAHAQRPSIAMQRRAPNDLSAFAACQLQTSSCGAFTFKGRDGAGCCCSWRTRPASGSLPRPAESGRFAWWVHPGALGSRTSGCAQILDKMFIAYCRYLYKGRCKSWCGCCRSNRRFEWKTRSKNPVDLARARCGARAALQLSTPACVATPRALHKSQAPSRPVGPRTSPAVSAAVGRWICTEAGLSPRC